MTMPQTGPEALPIPFDRDGVIADQSQLIGQLQTQVIMRDRALRIFQDEIARLTELVPKDAEPEKKTSGRQRPPSGE